MSYQLCWTNLRRYLMRVKLLAGLVTATFMSGCGTNVPVPPPTPPRVEGFQCLPIPSVWMEPGSIFSVDRDGTTYRIGKVEGIKESGPRPAGFPVFKATSEFNMGLLLNTLAKVKAATGWDASLGASAHSVVTIENSYEKPNLSITEGQPEEVAIAWFSEKYRIETGVRYFLVREAISANNATYVVSRDALNKVNAEASVKEMVKAKLDPYSNASNSGYVLKDTFPEPLNVCIKPRELVLLSSGANGKQVLLAQDVHSRISIRKVHQQ